MSDVYSENYEPGSILVVDDDEDLVESLQDILEDEGYQVYGAGDVAEAESLARRVYPSLAIVDLRLPDGSGTALVSVIRTIVPECLCILMTAFADVDSAVAALEKGVFYYVRKPVSPPDLIHLVEMAFENLRMKRQKVAAAEELRARNRELEEVLQRLKKMID